MQIRPTMNASSSLSRLFIFRRTVLHELTQHGYVMFYIHMHWEALACTVQAYAYVDSVGCKSVYPHDIIFFYDALMLVVYACLQISSVQEFAI